MPLKLLLQIFSFSLSLNNLHPSWTHSCSLSSGGNSPFSINLSKCSFRTLSIPEGKLGNGVSGLFSPFTNCNQKHLGHSNIRFIELDDILYIGFIIIPCLLLILLQYFHYELKRSVIPPYLI